jgi:hypothetical protein
MPLKKLADSMECPKSKLAKTIAMTTTPTRVGLQTDLKSFHKNTNYSTPVKDAMTTVIIQNHHQQLIDHHEKNPSSKAATPNTKAFMYSAQQLVKVGAQSIIQDRDKVLQELAQSYVTRGSKNSTHDDFIIHRPKHTSSQAKPACLAVNFVPPTANMKIPITFPGMTHSTFPLAGEQMFGGDLPSNSTGQRSRKSKWDGLDRRVCNSFFTAVAEFGPNTQSLKNDETANGFKVYYYRCRDSSCSFQTRVFYPLSIDSQIISNPSKESYQLIDQYVGPVISQISKNHSCNSRISWRMLLIAKNSRSGLNPILKDAVDREGNMDRYKLPRPDEMLRRIREQYAGNIDTLFPDDCLDIVSNQIKEYWKRRRRDILKGEDPDKILVRYLPDIRRFYHDHLLVIPTEFKVEAYIPTIKDARCFAERLLKLGTKTVPYKRLGSPISTRTAEHEMICLPIPSEEDPDYGHIVLKAREKDNASGQNRAYDHLVIFSSINLLRQFTVAHHDYLCKVMACIDSSHGADANGGKLMSFGMVTHKKSGNKGCDYRHGYFPLVLARILEENEETALYMLCALAMAIRDLFGLKLDFKGGLISDHANCFVNAYKTFFPDSPRGQCFPHVLLKVKDQRGRRKRGSPGYLSYNITRKNLKVATIDVKNMHRCKTEPLKRKYTELSLKGWRQPGKDNETPMADVFYKSYVQSEEHSRFRYNLFGFEGDSPQCNSLERFHLSAKGSRQFDGYCEFGKAVDEMLNYQFPKLVFHVSSRIDKFVRSYRISDEKACKADSELKGLVCLLNPKIDQWGPTGKGEYFYNNRGFEGTPINNERIERYALAMSGIFPSDDPSKRQELFDAANGFACVKEKVGVHGKVEVMCDCVRFWKSTSCQHAYHYKWGIPELLAKKQKKKTPLENTYLPASKTYSRGVYSYTKSGFST